MRLMEEVAIASCEGGAILFKIFGRKLSNVERWKDFEFEIEILEGKGMN